jgi:hypothetical protein
VNWSWLPARRSDITALRINLENTMADLTNAALAELGSAIDEVSAELDDIAGKLDAALNDDAAVDAETADAIRGAAGRLRGLRPDAPAPAEDAPADVPADEPAPVEDDGTAPSA